MSPDLTMRIASRKQELISELVEHKLNSCRFGSAEAIDKLKGRLSELAEIVKRGTGPSKTVELDAWIAK